MKHVFIYLSVLTGFLLFNCATFAQVANTNQNTSDTNAFSKKYVLPSIKQDQGDQPTPTPTATPQAIDIPTPTLPVANTPTPTPTGIVNQPPDLSQGQGANYTTSNNILYKNGSPIVLHGINWFGAETTDHVIQGMWARNWKDMINQMKGLGFNAVRVPICPDTLHGSSVTSIDYNKNPDMQGLNSQQVLDKVLDELNRQGMFILLDHHSVNCQGFTPLWYTSSYSEAQWLSDLNFMADRYRHLENFVGIDLKNEPYQVTWGSGNAGTDWKIAAEKAGKQVLATNSNLLIFVEGAAENPTCQTNEPHWWGGNFEPVNCAMIDTSAIPHSKLIFAPTVYGIDLAHLSYFDDPSLPNNMPAIWQRHFGFLVDKGNTVVIKEWGSKFGTNGGNPKDVQIQQALINYLSSKHICNSFYWAYNPDVEDPVQGLLKDDWQSIWQEKMNFITSYFNNCR